MKATVPGSQGAPTVAEVQLGRMLFFETRLSVTKDMSCNSCHMLDHFGVDGKALSSGHLGKPTSRNSPSVFNAARHLSQFWDGRSPDVEDQAGKPILNPDEMAMSSPGAAVAVLEGIPGYREAFAKAFPGQAKPVTWKNLGRAIGAFERVLVTPGRWDRFLEGDNSALSAREIAGFKVFADIGCVQCHTGELIGGSMFQKVGIITPWPNQSDPGRLAITKLEADRMLFKVPSLRGIAQTGPYFHDGSAATLEDAVRLMARHQLGVDVTPAEVGDMVAWMGSLTGAPPADLIAPPVLP